MAMSNEIEMGTKNSSVLITPCGAKSTYNASLLLEFFEAYTTPEDFLKEITNLVIDYAIQAGWSKSGIDAKGVADNIGMLPVFIEYLWRFVESREDVAV